MMIRRSTIRCLLAGVMLIVALTLGVSGAAAQGSPVARVGDTEYETLDEAVKAAQEGARIEVLADCELTEGFNKTLTFTGPGKITINKQLTSNGEGWMCFGLYDPSRVLTFDGVEVDWHSDGTSPWLMLSLSGELHVKNGARLSFIFDSRTTNTRNAIYMNAGSAIHVTNGSTLQIYGMGTGGNAGQGIQLDAPGKADIVVTDGSTFLIDGTNRGYVNSPNIYVEDSAFTVQNCTSNGSNGGEFTARNSKIAFLGNNGHGLSAGNVTFENSTVDCSDNAYYGFTYSGNMTMDETSVLNVHRNGYGNVGGGMRAAKSESVSVVAPGAKVSIQDNQRNGLENYGTFTFEEGASVIITGNHEPANGGGVYNAGTMVMASQTTVMNNHAEKTGGGICNVGTVTIPQGVQFYNNHADTAGDDLYNGDKAKAVLVLPSVDLSWRLDGAPDCTDGIDGWYDDSKGLRWNAHSAGKHMVKCDPGTYVGLAALKAAHGVQIDVNPGEPDLDLPIDKVADERLDEGYRAHVTLSMPSYATPLETDVVFVLDKSTSADVEEKAIDMLEALKAQVDSTQAVVKVGVVIFNKQANTNGALMDLANEYGTITEQIRQEISSGTNTHAGLLAGMSLLNQGAAANDRKYLIFVSDGITYMFGNQPTGIWSEHADRGTVMSPDSWGVKHGDNDPPAHWESYLQSVAQQVLADNGGYDMPYNVAGSFIPYEERDKHANTVDKALYLTHEAYRQAEAAGYHAFAVRAGAGNYAYHWGPSFMDYLAAGRDVSFDAIQNDLCYLYGAGTTITDVMGYGDTEQHGAYGFGFVGENMRLAYGVVNEAGELVAFPGYDEKAARVETDAAGNTHYFFGEGLSENDGEFAFELIYYPHGIEGPGNDVEHFTLTFNRNVRLGEQVRLTYQVELDESYRRYDPGCYDGLLTNKSAYVDPVDSQGEGGERQFFPMPVTSYENVGVCKRWAHDDGQGDDDSAVRPASIEVVLTETGTNGAVTERKLKLDAQTYWSGVFANVRAAWAVDEMPLNPGKGSYTCSQARESGNPSIVTFTNTYTKPAPEPTPDVPKTDIRIIKIWDDEGYTGRPDSFTVRVSAADDPTFAYTKEIRKNDVSVYVSDDGNTWTFYAAWNDHDYVIEEIGVPHYTSKVEKDGNVFTITNTYMPQTGDERPVALYALLILAGAAGLIGVALAMRRGRKA